MSAAEVRSTGAGLFLGMKCAIGSPFNDGSRDNFAQEYFEKNGAQNGGKIW